MDLTVKKNLEKRVVYDLNFNAIKNYVVYSSN
jgi:hypothetical protein